MIDELVGKIHHADCMAFMRAMPDKCVDLTLTDIPYGECDQESGGLRTLDKDFADRCEFNLIEFATELKRITRSNIYIFCGIGQISELYNFYRQDLSVRLCQWQKTNPSPMNGQHIWLSATENCLFVKFPGAVFNEFCRPNVWKFPCGDSSLHPTKKPNELFSYLIKTSSDPKDIVFDPCIGSGTTALAAIAAGRKYIGVEKNERMVNLCRQQIRRNRDMFYEESIR
jgi:DNA modification methylase